MADVRAVSARADRQEIHRAHERTLANPYVAAERGYIDAVISPSNTGWT